MYPILIPIFVVQNLLLPLFKPVDPDPRTQMNPYPTGIRSGSWHPASSLIVLNDKKTTFLQRHKETVGKFEPSVNNNEEINQVIIKKKSHDICLN